MIRVERVNINIATKVSSVLQQLFFALRVVDRYPIYGGPYVVHRTKY